MNDVKWEMDNVIWNIKNINEKWVMGNEEKEKE